MTSKWRQLLPQMLIMLVLYVVGVTALGLAGVEGFVPSVVVALVVAFGYPAALRSLGREPDVWKR
ncbi:MULTISPECIES: hypothetical protein [Halorussus]|uniref:hypothetical protein n=1 Tax=Halorussus TaxID=1070314 RepID=UPI000E215931|nr:MULTISPECIES: hypothetical protein [Halorussus]NHN61255.1 hypothetical protein [Halorussus sp. JP-T4]